MGVVSIIVGSIARIFEIGWSERSQGCASVRYRLRAASTVSCFTCGKWGRYLRAFGGGGEPRCLQHYLYFPKMAAVFFFEIECTEPCTCSKGWVRCP